MLRGGMSFAMFRPMCLWLFNDVSILWPWLMIPWWYVATCQFAICRAYFPGSEKHQDGNMCNLTHKGYYEGIWYIICTQNWLGQDCVQFQDLALGQLFACHKSETTRTGGGGCALCETLTVKLWSKPRLCESDSNTLAKETLGKCQHLRLIYIYNSSTKSFWTTRIGAPVISYQELWITIKNSI